MRQNMKIYQKEISDNLQDAIVNNNTIAVSCEIIPSNAFTSDLSERSLQLAKACHCDGGTQSDLYYLNSVLVSTGWNKNDDIFASEYLWAARNTPVNKPFNYMHDEADIIGHITGSMVLDQDGKIVASDESDEKPDFFDIVTSAVIYKSWAEKEQRDRIEKLTQEIEDGQWSVSMECIFSDFDYAVKTPDGEQRVIHRDEKSSFLTKHLRAYGGAGEYQGYKVGRLLKSYIFSGKGLVNKPANPRSVIFSKNTELFVPQSTAMEVYVMTQANEGQSGDLTESLKAAQLETESVKAEFLKAKEQFDNALTEKNQVIASYEVKIKELSDSLATAEKMKKDMEDECASMKKDMKQMKRKDKLSKAGVEDSKAEELLAKFQDASDEMFDSVVSLAQASKTEKTSTASLDSTLENIQETEESISKASEAAQPTAVEKSIASAVEFLSTVMKTPPRKREV